MASDDVQVAALTGQEGRGPSMGDRTSARWQLLVDRGPNDRVPELAPIMGDDHFGPDQGVEGIHGLRLRDAGQPGGAGQPGITVQDRHGPGQLDGRAGQATEAGQGGVGDRPRSDVGDPLGRIGDGFDPIGFERPGQLQYEERVAARDLSAGPDERRLRRLAELGRQQSGYALLAQRRRQRQLASGGGIQLVEEPVVGLGISGSDRHDDRQPQPFEPATQVGEKAK